MTSRMRSKMTPVPVPKSQLVSLCLSFWSKAGPARLAVQTNSSEFCKVFLRPLTSAPSRLRTTKSGLGNSPKSVVEDVRGIPVNKDRCRRDRPAELWAKIDCFLGTWRWLAAGMEPDGQQWCCAPCAPGGGQSQSEISISFAGTKAANAGRGHGYESQKERKKKALPEMDVMGLIQRLEPSSSCSGGTPCKIPVVPLCGNRCDSASVSVGLVSVPTIPSSCPG